MCVFILVCRNADKIKAPLLLMHGEEDNNPGTFPMQSERFYQVREGEPCLRIPSGLGVAMSGGVANPCKD